MDRLTKYSKETTHENGVCCTHFGGMECFACNGDCSRGCTWEEAAWSRLAAYEDTGLEPEQCENAKDIIESAFSDDTSKAERIRELLKADRDGRLVVLPCKVGDTVYFRTYDCNGTVDLGIQPHKVTAIVGHAIVRGGYTDVGLPSGQYGVSWFLTSEEAEEALEAMKDE